MLANENFPGAAVEGLRRAGHDVGWIRVEAPGSPDEAVLQRSLAERRVLLTFDKDFGELVFARGLNGSAGIILVRVISATPEATARFITQTLASQVKEKFGTLRVYLDEHNDTWSRLVDECEAASCDVCAFCGGQGRLIRDRGWFQTLCDGCAASVIAARRGRQG